MDESGGDVEDDDIKRDKVELVLVFLSDSYLELNSNLVSTSRLSSSSILYYLLIT